MIQNGVSCVVPVNSNLNIVSPDDLLDKRVRRIAIGDPEHVPVGIYAREALINMGLWNRLAHKFVPCADARSTLAHVEMETVEAAIVYVTDANITNKVKITFTFSPVYYSRITYSGCVLKSAPHPDAAEAFLGFLTLPYTGKIFDMHGFEPIVAEAD